MTLSLLRRRFAALAATLVLLAVAPAASAGTRNHTVVAPDGVALAVQEAGDPAGTPVVFVHGLLGSRLNWQAQLQAPALQRHRLITYDLRGHGLSGKPSQPEAYAEGRRWADDLHAVITALGVRKPVLVGWSLGGAVITNYLAAYGDAGLAGAVYVDGVVELVPEQIPPHPVVYRDMVSDDLVTHLDGEYAFLRLCFHRQPDERTFARLLANAALASWDMQRAVQSMKIPLVDGLGAATVPLLFIYGEHDALVNPRASIARAVQVNPRIRSTLYADSGHAPFIEEADRFNRELAAFITQVVRR